MSVKKLRIFNYIPFLIVYQTNDLVTIFIYEYVSDLYEKNKNANCKQIQSYVIF